MSVKIVCDGCGRDRPPPGGGALPAITLQRTDGWAGGGGLPNSDKDVHWCTTCACTAFAAVASAAGGTPRRPPTLDEVLARQLGTKRSDVV